MDIQRALDGQPWVYNNSLILIQRWRPGISLIKVKFEEMEC